MQAHQQGVGERAAGLYIVVCRVLIKADNEKAAEQGFWAALCGAGSEDFGEPQDWQVLEDYGIKAIQVFDPQDHPHIKVYPKE